VKKCFSAGELPCSSFSLGSFTRGPAGASRRGAYPGPGMHPSAAVGVMASRGQRDRGAWVGGRRLQRRRACAAGVCGTACLGGRGDALQPRPAGAAGSSGGLTGSAENVCCLSLFVAVCRMFVHVPTARLPSCRLRTGVQREAGAIPCTRGFSSHTSQTDASLAQFRVTRAPLQLSAAKCLAIHLNRWSTLCFRIWKVGGRGRYRRLGIG